MRTVFKLLLALSVLLPNLASAQPAIAPATTLGKGVVAGAIARKAIKPLIGGAVVGGGYLLWKHEHTGNQDIAEVSKWAVREYGTPGGEQALQDLRKLMNGHMFGPKYVYHGLAEEAVTHPDNSNIAFRVLQNLGLSEAVYRIEIEKITRVQGSGTSYAGTPTPPDPDNDRCDGPYDPQQWAEHFRQKYGDNNFKSHSLPDKSGPNVVGSKDGLSFNLNLKPDPATGLYENGIKEIRIPFDNRGFPIFDSIAKVDLKIPFNEYDRMTTLRGPHFKQATEILKELIRERKVSASLFTKEQLSAINSLKDKIPGYVWHHHQDLGRMQLVPKNIHDLVRHQGGFSINGCR